MLFGAVVSTTLGMLVARAILSTYGSDFNGLNGTILQIINVLLILEGGFMVAVNLALYKPAVENEQERINIILSTTKRTFNKIGIIFFAVGLVLSVIVPFVINTEISHFHVFLMFIMTLLPAAANLFFVMKYTCLFNAYQQEYIVQFINVGVHAIIHLVNLTIAFMGLHYLYIRGTHMVFMLLTCFVIAWVFKIKFPNVNFKTEPDQSAIKGTKDIFVARITGALYSAMPIILISIILDTRVASVFVVYMLVINAIKMILNSVVSAPRNAFGQLVAEGNKDKLYKMFFKYNLVNLIFEAVLLSTTLVLFIPFVSLYTANLYDNSNYINYTMVVLLVAITFLELAHIPSGTLMFVSGYFKQSRNIQIVAALVLAVFGLIGIFTFGIYGLLGAILLCALQLAICEIVFVYKKLFPGKLKYFCILIFSNSIYLVGLALMWYFLNINTVWMFLLWGIIISLINATFVVVFNFLVFNKQMRELLALLVSMIKRKKKKNEVTTI